MSAYAAERVLRIKQVIIWLINAFVPGGSRVSRQRDVLCGVTEH